MARLLFMGMHGSEDPTNAAMPFVMANGAVSAGHEAQIVIANEGAPATSWRGQTAQPVSEGNNCSPDTCPSPSAT